MLTPDIHAEVNRRPCGPKTVQRINEALQAIGYKLDRSMDCTGRAKIMTGPAAGESYPTINTGVKHIATGLSAFNVAAPRDENFKTLQAMRMSGEFYAIVRGRIFDI